MTNSDAGRRVPSQKIDAPAATDFGRGQHGEKVHLDTFPLATEEDGPALAEVGGSASATCVRTFTMFLPYGWDLPQGSKWFSDALTEVLNGEHASVPEAWTAPDSVVLRCPLVLDAEKADACLDGWRRKVMALHASIVTEAASDEPSPPPAPPAGIAGVRVREGVMAFLEAVQQAVDAFAASLEDKG